MNMRERRPAQWSPWWDYRDPPVTAMMRLHIAADDHQAEIAEAHQWPPWRYAEERRWPPAMRHGELHCSLHDSARGPGEKSPSIENKRALDGDEEDSEDSLLYRHRTNSAFLLKISLHTCSPRHSAAGLVLIDFHCGHDWAKIRFPGEITHKYSASPPTIS